MDENLSEQQFKYLENPRAALVENKSLGSPFYVNRDRKSWKKLDREVLEDINREVKDFDYRKFENGYDIVNGTINLINKIVLDSRAGEPVQTLVFMDKSARLGEYIFSVCWEQIRKKISAEGGEFLVSKPKIKFINSGLEGKEKHSHREALGELGNVYPSEDFVGKALVVDEYISTGGSVRRTGEALERAGYTPTSFEAIAQFEVLPNWYARSEAKGVSETPDISQENRRKIDGLPKESLDALRGLLSDIGYLKTVALLKRRFYFAYNNLTSQERDRIKLSKRNIRTVIKGLRSLGEKSELDPKEIIDYLASKGGYLSLPPDRDEFYISKKYRIGLKKLAEAAFENGLISMDSDLLKS